MAVVGVGDSARNASSGNTARSTADARAMIDRWVAETPTVTRSLSLGLIVSFVIGTVLGSYSIATVPLFVLTRLEVYRLLLSPWFESQVLSLFIVLLWANRTGLKIENDLGSRPYAIALAQVAIAINIVFCALVVFLAKATGAEALLVTGCQGLFPSIVALLVIVPPRGPISIAFIPVAIPAKFAPYALVAFAMILNGQLPLDLVCGVLVGHLYNWIPESWNFQARLFQLPLYASVAQVDREQTRASAPEQAPSTATATESTTKVDRSLLLEAAQARQNRNAVPGESQKDDKL
mmetsp:Transcript_1661/g.3252  ORF Transcript_1661/g.3252 Transcript_1661/m.3252 type:complete len:293 (+) Transcript_1661:95-973(+)